MKWFSLIATMFGCGSAAEKVSEGKAASGPFEIRWEVYSSRSGTWFNNGGNYNARQLTSSFSVYHHGKVIEIPVKEKNVNFFWQALFLKDAPQPAVLVGTHSMYLITEENGQPKVTPLHLQDGDFASFQWMDSENGKPGASQAVYLGDDSKNDRFLSGGRYLMINKRTILDVQTLKPYPIDVNTTDRIRALGDYNAFSSGILALSPGGTQLVLIGSRANRQNRFFFEYALVLIDFKTNTAYAVPFDKTETRFFSVWDATPEWIDTYFEWKKDKEGNDLLVKRILEKLPYWQGRYSNDTFSGKVSSYKLIPVKETMLEACYNFFTEHYKVTEVSREEMPDFGTKTINLTADGIPLYLYYQEKEKSLSIGKNKVSEGELEPFGRAFDAEMAKGKYQEFFDKFD